LSFDFSVLRELRQKHQLSLDSLAAESGVGVATLARLESNQNKPSLQTLDRLARVFGLSPAHLVDLSTSAAGQVQLEQELVDPGMRREISFPDFRARLGQGAAGDESRPHQHEGAYQITWVLSGRVRLMVREVEHELSAGQALRFDGAVEHSVEYLEDSELMFILIPKTLR
jgi:transcriptional regulator with XRE-family HTH domain